jgi:hypothetical protein
MEVTLKVFWAEIYPWLVSALGGFIGVALLLPTRLGEALIQFKAGKLLESFKAEQNQKLEQVKADQNRGLEQLKERLSHLGDRGRRSNEMEFAAIEAVWRAFVKAWLSTNTCIGSMMTIPRFSTMSHEEIESFVSSSSLNAGERELLLKSTDREKEYAKILNWRMVLEAGTDVYHARLTLPEQRIFMPAGLTKEFSDVIERMSGAQVERRLSLENPHIRAYDYGKASTGWLEDCVPTFDRMATLANQRLFREERGERVRQTP